MRSFSYLLEDKERVYENGELLVNNNNFFYPIKEGEIEEAERILGYPFPGSLVNFWKEVGTGNLCKPHVVPEGYKFYSSNEILPPLVVANFAKGIFEWEGQTHWMAEIASEMLEEGDLPFFEIGDSTNFMVMKAHSENPNAVWTDGIPLKIEDSLEQFIWNLYYKDPGYYGDIIDEYCKKLEQKKEE